MNDSILKIAGEEALRQNIEETKNYIESHGGHKIINSSGTQMDTRLGMQFSNMSVLDDSTNNKTIIRQTQIVSTEAEWNQMLTNNEVDPNITYYLPWMSNTEYAEDRTPIGTVVSVTTAKTGEVSGITTPTGEFPSSDYLVCDGAVKNIADYPKLADWFNEHYGSKNYFGGNGTTTFAVPDFTSDFPTNGILAIKAQMASTRVTYAEVDDSLTTGENVWSAEKVDARAVSIEEYIYHMNRRTRRDITSEITADHGAKLIAAVAEQDLAKYGYAIGDYFTGASGYTYTIADNNTFKGTSTPYCITGNHIGIVVATHATSKWHTEAATSVGYNGSTLHTYLKGTVLTNIKSDFTTLFGGWSNRLISHSKLLTTALANWAWQADQYISALTCTQADAGSQWSANGFQEGEASKSLELFRKYKWTEIFGGEHPWLRNISNYNATSAAYACNLYDGGHLNGSGGVAGEAFYKFSLNIGQGLSLPTIE